MPRLAIPSAALAALATLAALAPTSAQAITLVGLTSASQLALIDTADVSAATTTMITGLAAGDRLVGIDLRPSDNRIYGVSQGNRLYTIDAMSGAATQVAMLSANVVGAGQGWGVDFNPVADASGAASLRLVGATGGNYAVNASTGLVGNAANMIAPGFSGVAYTNSMPLPMVAPTSTALYYIDSGSDRLMRAASAFNTPTITDVGALGIDVLQANGFDIGADGMAYAALNTDGASLATGIYAIDLGSGSATLLGNYNGTLAGLTVSPVPEPQTVAMMLAGLLAVGALARRRRG